MLGRRSSPAVFVRRPALSSSDACAALAISALLIAARTAVWLRDAAPLVPNSEQLKTLMSESTVGEVHADPSPCTFSLGARYSMHVRTTPVEELIVTGTGWHWPVAKILDALIYPGTIKRFTARQLNAEPAFTELMTFEQFWIALFAMLAGLFVADAIISPAPFTSLPLSLSAMLSPHSPRRRARVLFAVELLLMLIVLRPLDEMLPRLHRSTILESDVARAVKEFTFFERQVQPGESTVVGLLLLMVFAIRATLVELEDGVCGDEEEEDEVAGEPHSSIANDATERSGRVEEEYAQKSQYSSQEGSHTVSRGTIESTRDPPPTVSAASHLPSRSTRQLAVSLLTASFCLHLVFAIYALHDLLKSPETAIVLLFHVMSLMTRCMRVVFRLGAERTGAAARRKEEEGFGRVGGVSGGRVGGVRGGRVGGVRLPAELRAVDRAFVEGANLLNLLMLISIIFVGLFHNNRLIALAFVRRVIETLRLLRSGHPDI